MSTTLSNDRLMRLFLRLSQDTDFVAWVEATHEKALGNLVEQVAPHLFHQTQGQVKLLNTVQSLMAASRK